MTSPRRIRSFLALAFGITWCIAGIGHLFGVDVSHPAYTLVAALCMFGPALAAVVQWRWIERKPWSALGLQPARVRWPFLLWTVVLALCITPLCMVVILVLGDALHVSYFGHVEVSGARLATSVAAMLEEQGLDAAKSGASAVGSLPGGAILLLLLLCAVLAAFTVNLPFMLGEELGWRGFLYEATSNWSPAKRIAFTGPVWGIWHAPLIMMGHNYPGYPFMGVFFMSVFCTLLALLFDWSRTRASSVWAPCVLHGIINGSAGAIALFAWDGHVLVASPAGVAGFVALVILGGVLLLLDGTYRRSFFRVPSEAPSPEPNFAS